MHNKIYGYPLLVIGSFLEIYYYQYRFSGDGTEEWLAWIISIGLTVLLTAALFFRNKKGIIIGIISLLIFSVLSTSAGQSMSMAQKSINKITVQNEEKIDRLNDQKLRKRDRYNKINELIDSSITNFDDMWEWKNTTLKYEQELSDIENEIIFIDQEIDKLLNPEISDINDQSNTYVFYNKLFGWNIIWSQFIFQTILSIFIALMAPYGLMLITSNQEIKNKDQIKYDIDKLIPMIRFWIQISFQTLKMGKEEITPIKMFYKWVDKKGIDFPKKTYKEILNAAINTGIISNKYVILFKEQQKAFDLLVDYFKEG